MRILLIGNYRPDAQESMLRFADLMQQGLVRAGHAVEVLHPPARLGRLRVGPAMVRKWLAYVDKFLLFPSLLRRAANRADVVHICDHSNAMYSQWIGEVPCVVTCHDLLAVRGAMGEPTDCPASFTGKYLQQWIVRGLRHASVVVPVSSATAEDLKRVVGAGNEHEVILNALNYPYHPIPRQEALARLAEAGHSEFPRPFVLHVGSNHPRKNRPGVIRAFALARQSKDLQLVLAGPPLTRELEKLIFAEGIADRVTVIEKPSNAVLEALYNLALALCFPSRHEGFGWPLVEAQACGCPVVCSDCAPFAEVTGGAAMMRDVEDEAGLAADIVRLAQDAQAREQWSGKGLLNAARFDPTKMIAGYVDVYQQLTSSHEPAACEKLHESCPG